MSIRIIVFLIILIPVLTSCGGGEIKKENEVASIKKSVKSKKVFSRLTPEETGVTFKNQLSPEVEDVFFNYQYIFNGAGVGIGDINNDGLSDVFFIGNEVHNKLYLNKGDLKFEDISDKAGIQAQNKWCTGVSMIDINGDGYLDIYVSSSSNPTPEKRKNLLFINNGDLTFSEKAAEYGIADKGNTSQSAFLDFDLDGDLDLYIANHADDFSSAAIATTEYKERPLGNGDRFYINENGKFIEKTNEVKLRYEMLHGFGLGVAVGDLNQDGYPDLYVGNDYDSPDYFYMNQEGKTFEDGVLKYVKHISQFSMGNDIADINNDGYLDIFTLDMVAEDNKRVKTQMGGMDPEKFYNSLEFGLPAQYMYNALQLNNGKGYFSDIAQMAGVSSTDWSWSVLMADYDNDGWKDIYITNGYRVDARDKDYLNRSNKYGKSHTGYNRPPEGIDGMPTTKLPNYLYRNNGDLTFSKKSYEWGLADKGYSKGAAFGDLDNDGDLDLVVNNLNDNAWIYKNNINEIESNNYVRVKLEGYKNYHSPLGAVVNIYFDDNTLQTQQLTVTRGYLSSVEPILHFGLGKQSEIKKLEVIWPDRTVTELANVKANQMLTLNYDGSKKYQKPIPKTLFEDTETNIEFTHTENKFNDFDKEILLPHRNSQHGPGLATGDLNGDGLEDFYVGGAADQVGEIFFQVSSGKFKPANSAAIASDKKCEDLNALIFDCDEDGDNDLYVVSGGNEFSETSALLQDRLYINDGKGQFSKTKDALPTMLTSGRAVEAGDMDGDGDLDLFVGGRIVPGKYPFAPRSYILNNDAGKFTDVTKDVAPELMAPGLVTDAKWFDYNGDKNLDLVVVGEWMAIQLFENQNGSLKNISPKNELGKNSGWWYSVETADIDNDGDEDIIAGNLGLNYKYRASKAEPFHVYCTDFDNSGSLDIVLGYYNDGVCYPLRGRQCSSQQMPFIKKKFPTYNDFGDASIEDVYGKKLKEALHYTATNFASCYIENKGNGQFEFKPFTNYAQVSCINAFLIEDWNNDGNLDILAAGNLFEAEVETPRNDASYGYCLLGDGKGGFTFLNTFESGFNAGGDVKDIARLKNVKGESLIIVANNDEKLTFSKHLSLNAL